MNERQQIAAFIHEGLQSNLLVNLGSEGVHYVEDMEQTENGKLTIHAWNRGESPKHDFSLLDMTAQIFIVRDWSA